MNAFLVASLLVVCLVQFGEANDGWLFLTANNNINQVCVDGKQKPRPKYSKLSTKLGKVSLPEGWSSVNVYAQNRKGKAGVLGYVKQKNPTGIRWTCKPKALVKNKDCCKWDGSKGSLKVNKAFRPYGSLVPNRYPAVWVWSSRPDNKVCCKLWSCPPLCRTCRWSGKKGKCDKCIAGSSRDSATGLCSKFCKVEINVEKRWIKTWDVFSGKSYTWKLQADQSSIAVVDPATCKSVYRQSAPPLDPSLTIAINDWVNPHRNKVYYQVNTDAFSGVTVNTLKGDLSGAPVNDRYSIVKFSVAYYPTSAWVVKKSVLGAVWTKAAPPLVLPPLPPLPETTTSGGP